MEYVFDQTLALRGGYKLNYDVERLSGGIGVRTTLMGTTIAFDYAFTDFGALRSVNRLSLGMQL